MIAEFLVLEHYTMERIIFYCLAILFDIPFCVFCLILGVITQYSLQVFHIK